MLAALLERHDVTEELDIRSRLGFMAYHGGSLEKTTDAIAREAAELAGASYYGVVQEDEDPTHIASTRVVPEDSEALASFLDHVDVVLTIHSGYGREHLFHSVPLTWAVATGRSPITWPHTPASPSPGSRSTAISARSPRSWPASIG